MVASVFFVNVTHMPMFVPLVTGKRPLREGAGTGDAIYRHAVGKERDVREFGARQDKRE